ncbi:MAG: hypothetical protein WBQ50_10820 [Nocardioides sp.]
MSTHGPFSSRRVKRDLVSGLPAAGMVVGAVVGALGGFAGAEGGPVGLGGLGILAGLAVGTLLRLALRPDPEEEQ